MEKIILLILAFQASVYTTKGKIFLQTRHLPLSTISFLNYYKNFFMRYNTDEVSKRHFQQKKGKGLSYFVNVFVVVLFISGFCIRLFLLTKIQSVSLTFLTREDLSVCVYQMIVLFLVTMMGTDLLYIVYLIFLYIIQVCNNKIYKSNSVGRGVMYILYTHKQILINSAVPLAQLDR